jgi:hypothetical protein
MALFIGSGDGQALVARGTPDAEVNLWAIGVAQRDLRKALAAFQQHEPPPPREFPPPSELVAIAHPRGQGKGLEGIGEWLDERGVR